MLSPINLSVGTALGFNGYIPVFSKPFVAFPTVADKFQACFNKPSKTTLLIALPVLVRCYALLVII